MTGQTNTTEMIGNQHDDRADIETVFTSWEGIIITVNSAIISIAASVLVIFLISRSDKGLSGSVYHRILFGMSVSDIIQSFAMALTTLPMPTDMIYSGFQGLVLGNDASCNVQGFLAVLGVYVAMMYNAVLSIYYLCSIRYNISDEDFQRRFEPMLHFASFVLGSIPAFMAFGRGLSKPDPTVATWCRPSNYPWWCEGEECDGADLTHSASNSIFSIISGSSLIIIIVSMILIVAKVRWQERQMKISLNTLLREEGNHELPSNATSTTGDSDFLQNRKVVTRQAFAYTCINLFNFCIIVVRSLFASTKSSSFQQGPVIQVLYLVLRPLQGLFNSIIFVYHKVQSIQRERPTLSFFSAFRMVLKGGEGNEQVFSNIFIVRHHEAFSNLRMARNFEVENEDDEDAEDDEDDDDVEDEGNIEMENVRNGNEESPEPNSSTSDSDNEDEGNVTLVHTVDPSAASINELSGFSSISSRHEGASEVTVIQGTSKEERTDEN